MLAGQHPGQQPHCGARIPRIERASSAPQPINARSCNHNACVTVSASPFQPNPQPSKAIQGALAICRCGVMADFTSPSRQRRKNGITMRDGLISRKFNQSGDRMRRRYGYLCHATILTCGQNTLLMHGWWPLATGEDEITDA